MPRSPLQTLKALGTIVVAVIVLGGAFIGATRYGLDNRYVTQSVFERVDRRMGYLVCRDRGGTVCSCESHLPPSEQTCRGGLADADSWSR
jgi:hypothetical protein